jgi:predicted MPP superfamily phosphohydrolase
MDFNKEKFVHRASEWQPISTYKQRHIFRKGKYVDIVEYKIPTKITNNKGKKLLWFSDLHLWGNLKVDEKIAEESSLFINDLSPDYLVYGGDLVMYSSALPMVRDFFQSLPESRKLAILGNWEYAKKWLTVEDWDKFFTDCDFKLLINESCEFDNFFFYGTDDLRRGKPSSPVNIPQNKEIIFLAHSPDAYIHICDSDIASLKTLVLCGHTHGGQVRLPFYGALLTSSRYWRKFDYGHFTNSKNASNMIVSSGLGCSTFPIRFGCRRELVLVSFV